VGLRVGEANVFLGQSIGIDKDNTFQLTFLFQHQNCRSHSLGGENQLALRKKLRNLHAKSQ